MADSTKFLDDFLALSNYSVLSEVGKVSAFEAKVKAEDEYTIYRQRQDLEYVSGFDRETKRIEENKP